MKDGQKKNTIFLVVIVIALILVVIGITFAAFNYSRTGTTDNVLTLGDLKLTLQEGNEINISDALPMSDEDGLASAGFTFSLQNSGNVPIQYQIYLDDVAVESNEVALDEVFLKYSLDVNGSVGSAALLNSLGTGDSRLLTSGTINGSVTNQYVLRVWIRSDMDADIQGQVWKGKLRIEGAQVQ